LIQLRIFRCLWSSGSSSIGASRDFFRLTQGALGGSDGSTHGRASSLGGHLGGQTGSEDTGGGHCDDVRGDGVWMGKCGKSLVWRLEEDGEISAWREKKREQSWEERKRLEEESR
jgi:hypothetical protein